MESRMTVMDGSLASEPFRMVTLEETDFLFPLPSEMMATPRPCGCVECDEYDEYLWLISTRQSD